MSESVADTLDVADASPAKPGDRFEEFYAAYPKHTGRADAERKWRSIVKTPDTAQAIIDAALALSRHELCPKPSDSRMRFVPAPAVWLNKGSWTDDYPMWRRWEDDAAETAERAARQGGNRPANRVQGTQRDTDSFSDMFGTTTAGGPR